LNFIVTQKTNCYTVNSFLESIFCPQIKVIQYNRQ